MIEFARNAARLDLLANRTRANNPLTDTVDWRRALHLEPSGIVKFVSVKDS